MSHDNQLLTSQIGKYFSHPQNSLFCENRGVLATFSHTSTDQLIILNTKMVTITINLDSKETTIQ